MGRTIYFQSKPLTLVGRKLDIGTVVPYFQAVSLDLEVLKLPDLDGKIKVITSFPSIDTPVCDLQVKEFNKRATGFSSDVALVAISMDLPFAQKRFCDANTISNLKVVSDYRFSSFGINYGLLIKELNLLARSVLIVDKINVLRYVQIVEELTHAPNYNDVLSALDEVLKNPSTRAKQDLPGHCSPCEKGAPALPEVKVKSLLAQFKGWELIDQKKIKKSFSFKDFSEGKTFLDLIASVANEQGHHPSLSITYNKVTVSLTTHASEGLTDNDFIMAKVIDQIGEL